MTNGGTVFAAPFYWCYSACSTISHGATGTVPPWLMVVTHAQN